MGAGHDLSSWGLSYVRGSLYSWRNPAAQYLSYRIENCQTLRRQRWSYRWNAQLEDFLSFSELLVTLVSVVATHGNL